MVLGGDESASGGALSGDVKVNEDTLWNSKEATRVSVTAFWVLGSNWKGAGPRRRRGRRQAAEEAW